VPVYATETAEYTSRGQFIALEFTLNIFGVVIACSSFVEKSLPEANVDYGQIGSNTDAPSIKTATPLLPGASLSRSRFYR
jgi:hypothetical protein